jgi:hypothetical protein
MAEKDNGGHELAILIAVISLIVAVVGAAAGLAQLQPVRDFVCEEASVLCKRQHVLSLFKMSYITPASSVEDTDPWMTVLNDSSSLFIATPRNNTGCIDVDDFSRFLSTNKAVKDGDNYVVSFGESRWIFDSRPIDTNKEVKLTHNTALFFYLGSKYEPLVRDVTFRVSTAVENQYRQFPDDAVERTFILNKGSRERDVFCELFFPDQGNYTFRFSFRDDVWDADDSIVVPLTISIGQNNQ